MKFLYLSFGSIVLRFFMLWTVVLSGLATWSACALTALTMVGDGEINSTGPREGVPTIIDREPLFSAAAAVCSLSALASEA